MVEKFQTILTELVHRHGPVYLFGIMQMDELADKWTIVLSAPWVTAVNYQIVFEEIRKLLVGQLTNEELSSIARLGIWMPTDHFIELLLKYQAGTEINNQKINGNMVYKGYIIESNPSLVTTNQV